MVVVVSWYTLPDSSNWHGLGSTLSLTELFVCHDYLWCMLYQASMDLRPRRTRVKAPDTYFEASAGVMGLHTNWHKTKIQNIGTGDAPGTVHIDN